jgi:tetratricopeptide (TPR) repeat protein
MGDYPNALLNYQNTVSIFEKSLPPDHPHLAMINGNIGKVNENMGEYSNARSIIKKRLKSSKNLFLLIIHIWLKPTEILVQYIIT